MQRTEVFMRFISFISDGLKELLQQWQTLYVTRLFNLTWESFEIHYDLQCNVADTVTCETLSFQLSFSAERHKSRTLTT